MSITPRFWPSNPLAGLGRNWNSYLLTMLTWTWKDSMPLSAAPLAPKGDQGWIFWSYKSNYLFSLSGLPDKNSEKNNKKSEKNNKKLPRWGKKSAIKLILRLRNLISKRIPNKDNYNVGTDPTMENQIRRTNNWIYKTKIPTLIAFGACGAADRGIDFMISGSNQQLQQQLEYTLLKPDCLSWWISKMQSRCEDTLEERYAIKFCLKLGKMAQKRTDSFRLIFNHLAWIEHEFLSGIRDSRKAGSQWGMIRGVGGVRKSIHQNWLAKDLGLLCWGFKGVQEEISSEEANTLQIG